MRGGKRIGAGRPKSQTAKRSVQIRIPEHLADRLPKRPAALIEKLLINHFNSQNMTEVKFVNLMQHDVMIFDKYDIPYTFEKSGMVACVSFNRTSKTIVTDETSFNLYTHEFGEVYIENKSKERELMFVPQNGVVYIVSTLVKKALPHRKDLICPNTVGEHSDDGYIQVTDGFMLP